MGDINMPNGLLICELMQNDIIELVLRTILPSLSLKYELFICFKLINN